MIQKIFGPDKEDPIDSDFDINIEDNLLVTLSFSEPILSSRKKENQRSRPKSSLIVPSINSISVSNHKSKSNEAEFRTKSAPNLHYLKEDFSHVSPVESKSFKNVVYADRDIEISSGSDDVFESDHVSVEDNIQIWDNQRISAEFEDCDHNNQDQTVMTDPKHNLKENDFHREDVSSDAGLHFVDTVPGAIIPTTLSEEDSKSSRAPSRTTIIDVDNCSKKRKSWWTIMFFCLSRN